MDSEDVAKYLIECGADIRPQKGTGEHFQVVFNGHKSTIPNHCEGCEAHPAGAADAARREPALKSLVRITPAYAVKLEPDEDAFLLRIPALDEVLTCGDTKSEALKHAPDALAVALHYRMEDNEDIPEPDAKPGALCAVAPPRAAMKVLLYQAMRRRGLGKDQFSRLLGIDAAQMAEIFDIDHATAPETIDAAMNALTLYKPAPAQAAE